MWRRITPPNFKSFTLLDREKNPVENPKCSKFKNAVKEKTRPSQSISLISREIGLLKKFGSFF